MTIDEVIRDIHLLARELEQYEAKYGVLSQDFYRLYIEGKLPDEEPEQVRQFSRWAGLYEARQELLSQYGKLGADSGSTRQSAGEHPNLLRSASR